MRAVAALAGLAFLSACGQSAEKAATAAGNEEFPVVEAPVANTSIGPDGAAGISTAIPLTVEAAQAAAPHFIVAASEGMVEGDQFPIVTLSLADEIVFTLMPAPGHERIGAIVTRSSQARGPANEVIGQSTFGQAQAAGVLFCREAQPWEVFTFTCAANENANFWRAYTMPESYQGDRMPFTAIDPDAVLTAVLTEMSWIAPREESDQR
ncbi:MAG: hypothetical protein AB7J28_06055 [Hyphomonadaceae bacterium]